MKRIILAAFMLCCISVEAFADKPGPPPPSVTHKKKKHKVVIIIPPPVRFVPPPVKHIPPPVVFVPPTMPPVIPPPVVKVCPPKECPKEGSIVPNLHLALGLGLQDPWASGLVGLRLEFPKVYLGVEGFISLPYGMGIEGMVYAYRGPVIQFYPLSVGFMFNFAHNRSNLFLSDRDVNRLVDLRLGFGVQIKLACHVKLSIDFRTSIPDPIKLANENGVCQQCKTSPSALNAGNAIGNAFGSSQILFGVLFQ